jgi:hypothetical protein
MRIVPVLGLVAILVAGCVSSGAESPEPSETPLSPTFTVDPSLAPSSSAMPAAPTATAAVVSASPSPSPSADATTGPTPPPVPPKPSGVSFDTAVGEPYRVSGSDDRREITQTVTWQAPRDEGVEIRVYGVTECLARPDDPAPGTNGPCLVVNTKLPQSIRVLLATAPASAGTVSWSWTTAASCGYDWVWIAGEPDGPIYHAVVLAAYGPSGYWGFTIAEPGSWYEPAPDEVIC